MKILLGLIPAYKLIWIEVVLHFDPERAVCLQIVVEEVNVEAPYDDDYEYQLQWHHYEQVIYLADSCLKRCVRYLAGILTLLIHLTLNIYPSQFSVQHINTVN